MTHEPQESFRENLTPMLEGKILTSRFNDDTGSEEFLWPNGSVVAPVLFSQIVYVNPHSVETKDNWWALCGDQSLSEPLFNEPMQPVTVNDVTFHHDDIANMLIVIGGQVKSDADEASVQIDAGFFHRTIGRFIGFWEENAPESMGVEWDYQFWKAELRETDSPLKPQAEPDGQHIRSYEVLIFRGEDKPPNRYQYWVSATTDGKIVKSAWLSAPPNLLGNTDSKFTSEPSHQVSRDEVEAMFQDINEDA